VVDIKKLHFANYFKVFEDPNEMQKNELAFDSELRLIYKDEDGNLHPIMGVNDYKNIYNPDSIFITQTVKNAVVGVGTEGDYSDKVSRSMPLSSKVIATDIHNRVMLVQYDESNNVKDIVLLPEYFCKLNGYADQIDINRGIMTEYVKKIKVLEKIDSETLENNKIFKIVLTDTEDIETSLGYPLTIEENKDNIDYRDHIYIGEDNYLYVIKDKNVEDLEYPFWVLNRRSEPATIKVDTTMMLLDRNDRFVFESYRKVVDIMQGSSYKFIQDDEDFEIVKVLSAVKTTIYGVEKVELQISPDKKSVVGLEPGVHYSITVITDEPFIVPRLEYEFININEGFFAFMYTALKYINDNEQQLPIDVIESMVETVRLSLVDYLDIKLTDKADLDSPEFTGTPTAPTAEPDTDTDQIATTKFVLGQAGDEEPLMDGEASPGTSKKFARIDHKHPTDTSRAPVDSPAFTGTPTAPTAEPDTDTDQIATTAYVIGQAGDEEPLMDGEASAGTSKKFSRADHKHPTDTSRAPVDSPTFTGIVKTPDIDMQGNRIINVANISAINLLGDSGRFMGNLLDSYAIESDNIFVNNEDFFKPHNGGNVSPAGKFINNNINNGGDAGVLTEDVELLIDAINSLTGKGKRYGAEFYVANITQGSNTDTPHDVNTHHYLLVSNNKFFAGSDRFFTFSTWIRVKNEESLTIQKSFKLYKNGVEIEGDYLELFDSDGWVHIQSIIKTEDGFDQKAPYLYAPEGAIIQIALPVITSGGTGVGIHSAPIPKGSIGYNPAPIDSPVFTGNVILPSTTSIGDITPEEISYLQGLEGNIQEQLNSKVDPESPSFIGVPTAPTADPDTESDQIATTAFVLGQASDVNPLMDGEASPGTSKKFARADHKHPTDTTRAPIDSPTFTGDVTLPETTTIGDITYEEISLLTGLIGNIQEQLDEKASLNSPSFEGSVNINGDLNVNNIIAESISLKASSGTNRFTIEYNEEENSIDFIFVP